LTEGGGGTGGRGEDLKRREIQKSKQSNKYVSDQGDEVSTKSTMDREGGGGEKGRQKKGGENGRRRTSKSGVCHGSVSLGQIVDRGGGGGRGIGGNERRGFPMRFKPKKYGVWVILVSGVLGKKKGRTNKEGM